MTTTEIASIIQLRSGTQAELDALPSGQFPLPAEPIWTTDTKRLYVGIDPDTPPSLMGSSFVMTMEEFDAGSVTYAFRGGAQLTSSLAVPNAAGGSSLDIQSRRTSAAQVASGNFAVAIGTNCTASGSFALAIGTTVAATGSSGSMAFGRSITNAVANSLLIGQTSYAMRGTALDSGWIQTIRSNASAHAAHGSTISDCPAGSLPTGFFGFRRNGNQILIDINTDGTVRTLSLGTAT